MRKILFLLLISTPAVQAGFERSASGGRAQGLAGAYTALGKDVWSVFYNPAGLARILGSEAGFFLSPRPFGLSELSFSAAAAAFRTPVGSIGISGSRYGFALYREVSLSLSVAVPTALGDVGLTLVRYAASIDRYGSGSAYAVDAGYALELDHALRMGFRVRNINAPTIGRAGERLRESVAMGIAYRPDAEVVLAADMLKEFSFNPSFRAGVEYQVAQSFIVRLGVSDQPSQFHGGVGVRQGFAAFDYAFSLHESLGMTHECSLTLRWGGGGNE